MNKHRRGGRNFLSNLTKLDNDDGDSDDDDSENDDDDNDDANNDGDERAPPRWLQLSKQSDKTSHSALWKTSSDSHHRNNDDSHLRNDDDK